MSRLKALKGGVWSSDNLRVLDGVTWRPLAERFTYRWTGTVNDSASEKLVDGVVVDTNLAINPSAETSAQFNANASSNTPVRSATRAHSGTYSTKLNRGTGSSVAAASTPITTYFPFRTAGKKVKISGWLYVPSGLPGLFGIRLAGAGIVEGAGSTVVTTEVRDQWVRVQTEGTDVDSGTVNFQVYCGDNAADIWIDDLKVTYGDAGHAHGEYFDGSTVDGPALRTVG